jgi:L-threonylcarbamoyladenylate synthase
MPAILDWRQAAPDDLARQAAQALADGGLVLLPSEIGLVLAADPSRLADPARPAGLPDGIAVHRLDGYLDAAAFFAQVTPTSAERALAARLWPGPIGWAHDDSPFPAWVPGHNAIATVLALRPAPVALFEIDAGRPLEVAEFGEAIAFAIIDGQPQSGAVTVIRPNDNRWSLVRPGAMSETDIRLALARQIVFVCTGNTCRSPMAEAVFRRRLAERLGCDEAALLERGFAVSSAGLSAMTGDAAATDAIEVLREVGIDLTNHRSQAASADLIARADDLIAMTRSHVLMLLSRYPMIAGAVRLLCGAEGDLDDPIARGPEVYRACALTIERHVDRLLTEMGLT